jgi:hypothetical protein
MAQTRASTGAGTGAETVATERVEIVTRGERRRSYTPEDKTRLLEETATPGARVLEVAQRHGISPSLLHRWRREAEGRPLRKIRGPCRGSCRCWWRRQGRRRRCAGRLRRTARRGRRSR